MTYTYLADGTKVSAVIDGGEGLRYSGSFVYAVSADGSETLESVGWDEGRIIIGSDGTAGQDQWFVRDHLGNVRSVIDLSAPEGSTAETALVEQSDYLPFGTRIAVTGGSGASDNRYRYAGKEEQRFGTGPSPMDLEHLDFGARFYDPFTARWTTSDPLAAKYPSISPYAYCGNDPVNFVDPDGRDIWDVDCNGTISHVKSTRREIVRTVGTNGDVIRRTSVKGANLSVGNLDVAGQNYQYFKSSNDKATKRLFEFVASPSSWGKSNSFASVADMNESSVMYTDMGNAVLLGENGRVPTASLAIDYVIQGAIFSRIDHVHPNNNPDPSGIGEGNGDIETIHFLDNHRIRFSTPEDDRYHICTPQGKSYYSYDIYSTLMIKPSTIKANKR